MPDLRDQFAAAALTGLLEPDDVTSDTAWWKTEVCKKAYEWADAMLRERGIAVGDNCVAGNQPEIGCPVTEPMPKEKRADVSVNIDGVDRPVSYAKSDEKRVDCNTAGEPVAWAVVSDSKHEIDCEFVYPDSATAGDVALDINGGVVPLYRHPALVPVPPAYTEEERAALATAKTWLPPYYATAHKALARLMERTK